MRKSLVNPIRKMIQAKLTEIEGLEAGIIVAQDMVEEGSVQWKTVVRNFYPDLEEAVENATGDDVIDCIGINFHDVKARVRLGTLPKVERNLTIPRLLELVHCFFGFAKRRIRARFDFHKNRLFAIGKNQIRFPKRRTVILRK